MVTIPTILALLTTTLTTTATAFPSLITGRQPPHGPAVFNIGINANCAHGEVPNHNPSSNTLFLEDGIGAGTDGGEPGTCFDQINPFNVLFIFSVQNNAGLDCGITAYDAQNCTGTVIRPPFGIAGGGDADCDRGYHVPGTLSFKFLCTPQ